MKKLFAFGITAFAIIASILFVSVSCSNGNEGIKIRVSNSNDQNTERDLHTFVREIDGHKYVIAVVKENGVDWANNCGCSIVHAESCPCKYKYDTNE